MQIWKEVLSDNIRAIELVTRVVEGVVVALSLVWSQFLDLPKRTLLVDQLHSELGRLLSLLLGLEEQIIKITDRPTPSK